MWKLIIFFVVGLRKKQGIIKICARLSEYTIFLLLFLLGFLMGGSPVIKNVLSMGIDAVLLSVFSIIGSILAILPFEKRLR